MRRVSLMLAAVVATIPFSSLAQQAGPYKVLQTVKVGGEGGFDYVYADDAGRKLYVPRSGPAGRITVFDLDSLAPAGEIPNVNAHGAVVDYLDLHAFGRHFFVFNVADAAINVGVALLILDLVFAPRAPKGQSQGSPPRGAI